MATQLTPALPTTVFRHSHSCYRTNAATYMETHIQTNPLCCGSKPASESKPASDNARSCAHQQTTMRRNPAGPWHCWPPCAHLAAAGGCADGGTPEIKLKEPWLALCGRSARAAAAPLRAPPLILPLCNCCSCLLLGGLLLTAAQAAAQAEAQQSAISKSSHIARLPLLHARPLHSHRDSWTKLVYTGLAANTACHPDSGMPDIGLHPWQTVSTAMPVSPPSMLLLLLLLLRNAAGGLRSPSRPLNTCKMGVQQLPLSTA